MAIICLLFISLSITAAPLKKGDLLPSITLNNQHKKPITISADIRTLLFSADKAPSMVINQLLKGKPDYLEKHKAYFIADISGMPFLISKFIAVPKMKRYPYDVLLVRNSKWASFIPHKKGYVSVLKISANKVISVNFAKNKQALTALIK